MTYASENSRAFGWPAEYGKLTGATIHTMNDTEATTVVLAFEHAEIEFSSPAARKIARAVRTIIAEHHALAERFTMTIRYTDEGTS